MATITKRLDVAEDKCYHTGSAWTWSTATLRVVFGRYLSTYQKEGMRLRFIGCAIPPGSYIKTGTNLTFNPSASISTVTVKGRITAQKSANAAACASIANYQALRGPDCGGANEDNLLIDSQVTWNPVPAWVHDVGAVSPELQALVQAVVDQAEWTGAAGGYTISIFADDHKGEGDNTDGDMRSIDCLADDANKAVLLTVEYELPPAIATLAATNLSYQIATLNGELTDLRSLPAAKNYGFVWKTGSAGTKPGNVDPSTDPNGYTGWKSDAGSYGVDTWSHNLSGLLTNTTYRVRFCIKTDWGVWVYGDEVTFIFNVTHRISNSNTPGVRKGNVLLEGAKIFVVDLCSETLAKAVTDELGMFVADWYSDSDVVPKICAFCVWDDKATLLTAQGSNKDLLLTAKASDGTHWFPGEHGNDLAIIYEAGAGHDDFEWGANTDSLATSGGPFTWTVGGGACTISTDQAHAGSRGAKFAGHASTSSASIPREAISMKYALSIWGRKPTATGDIYPILHGDGTQAVVVKIDSAEKIWYRNKAGTWVDTGSVITADTWFKLEVRRMNFLMDDVNPVGTYDLYLNDAKIGTSIQMYQSASYNDIFQIHNQDTNTSNHFYVDDVRILPYPLVGFDGTDTVITILVGGTTAAEIKAIIEAHPDVNLMIGATLAEGQDGSGKPGVMAHTHLSGGMYYSDVAHVFITPTDIV